MDNETLNLIGQVSNNLTVIGLLLYTAYKLSVALSKESEAKEQAINRYIEHLEAFHPAPPDDN